MRFHPAWTARVLLPQEAQYGFLACQSRRCLASAYIAACGAERDKNIRSADHLCPSIADNLSISGMSPECFGMMLGSGKETSNAKMGSPEYLPPLPRKTVLRSVSE